MSCISRTRGHPLTANQRAQLLGLLRAGAVSRETGKPIADVPMIQFTGETDGMWPGNPLVIGALRDRGLADSRSVRGQGRSWTEYWLLDAGAAVARDIESALRPEGANA